MTNCFRASVVQHDIVWCEPSANRQRIESLISDAPQTDLFVLSEMYTTGFCMEPVSVSEPVEGETLAWMCRLSKAKDCALAGSIVITEGGRYFNRLYFVKPNGEVTYYDKRHLFTYGGEHQSYCAGRDRVIVAWRGVRFLLQICYDLRFPVFARNRNDYDAIIYVANWPDTRIVVWNTLLQARALENQCYVLAANRIGDIPLLHYSGHSQIVDAYGRLLARAEDNCEMLIHAELDMDRLATFRRKFPVLGDRDEFFLT